jgi:hypothetical protein
MNALMTMEIDVVDFHIQTMVQNDDLLLIHQFVGIFCYTYIVHQSCSRTDNMVPLALIGGPCDRADSPNRVGLVIPTTSLILNFHIFGHNFH